MFGLVSFFIPSSAIKYKKARLFGKQIYAIMAIMTAIIKNMMSKNFHMNFIQSLYLISKYDRPIIKIALDGMKKLTNPNIDWNIITKVDNYHTMFVMLFATLLVKCFGKVSFDEIIESFGEGFQKIASTVVAMLAVYLVLEFAFEFPVLPAVIAWFESLTTGFSAFFASIAVTSMGKSFNPESKHEIPVPPPKTTIFFIINHIPYMIIISRCKEKSNF